MESSKMCSKTEAEQNSINVDQQQHSGAATVGQDQNVGLDLKPPCDETGQAAQDDQGDEPQTGAPKRPLSPFIFFS